MTIVSRFARLHPSYTFSFATLDFRVLEATTKEQPRRRQSPVKLSASCFGRYVLTTQANSILLETRSKDHDYTVESDERRSSWI